MRKINNFKMGIKFSKEVFFWPVGIVLLFASLVFMAGSLYHKYKEYEVSVIGPLDPGDGIGRQALDLVKLVQDDFNVNFIDLRNNKSTKLRYFLKIPFSTISEMMLSGNNLGKIVVLEGTLPYNKREEMGLMKKAFSKSKIKDKENKLFIAYSMFESTDILKSWVRIINKHFDMVVVPAEFLIEIYEKAGVKVPIFVVPLGIKIDYELAQPIKKHRGKVFRFGNLGTLHDRKNQIVLVKAFEKLFKNRDDVELILNARNAEKQTLKILEDYIFLNDITNVHLSVKPLTQKEYHELSKTIDCFVYPSKGEGFSVMPRESMALGIPVIVSDNTGQSTIAASNLVRSVKSEILKPALYPALGDVTLGYNFDTKPEDLEDAMQDVYVNYDSYLKKSEQMRDWAAGYQYKNLKNLYKNMIRPKNLILGSKNEISNDYLMTNSTKLYNKYKAIWNMSE